MMKLLKLAEDGNAHAQYDIGRFCYTGTEVFKKDPKRAKALFVAASEQGHIPSMAALGDCYADEGDKAEAEHCYRVAAEKGDPHGQYGIALLGSGSESLRLLTLSAEQGYIDAQVELANRYADDTGETQNKSEAVRWYREAAEQGDAEAQRKLADCYIDAWVVPEKKGEATESYRKRQAARLYRKAAEQGDCEAQKRLARCYADGCGVVQNEVQAAKWYRRAGDNEAYEELGSLFAEMGQWGKAKGALRKAGIRGSELRHWRP